MQWQLLFVLVRVLHRPCNPRVFLASCFSASWRICRSLLDICRKFVRRVVCICVALVGHPVGCYLFLPFHREPFRSRIYVWTGKVTVFYLSTGPAGGLQAGCKSRANASTNTTKKKQAHQQNPTSVLQPAANYSKSHLKIGCCFSCDGCPSVRHFVQFRCMLRGDA